MGAETVIWASGDGVSFKVPEPPHLITLFFSKPL